MDCGDIAAPISIHALLTEGDALSRICSLGMRISIHALLTEGDQRQIFLLCVQHKISIHALLTEGDGWEHVSVSPCSRFQSTPSSRRATVLAGGVVYPRYISIHALLTEGDRCWE